MIKTLLIIITLSVNIFGLELSDFFNKEICNKHNYLQRIPIKEVIRLDKKRINLKNVAAIR